MITIFGRQFKNFSQLRKFIGYGAITEKMAIDRSGSLEQFVKDVLKVNTDDEAIAAFDQIYRDRNEATTTINTKVLNFLKAFWILSDQKSKDEFIKIYKVTNNGDVNKTLQDLEEFIEDTNKSLIDL